MTLSTLTFGCRVNAAESLVMQARASEAGLDDAILVNTCAVTQEAVRQARQAIRRARRENPSRRIVVAGCAAQIDPQAFASMPEVDRVLGNTEKLFADAYRGIGSRAAPEEKIAVGDIMRRRESASPFPERIVPGTIPVRTYVEVQNGCDHRCTFCVIPFGRGPSRSLPADAIVDRILRLLDAGAREIVLSGVDLTAWGNDLAERPSLGSLVRTILRRVPALLRLRLSSIDCVEADDELLQAFADEERLMPHLHLSLQSGSDLILKRMKRRHRRADAIRFCERVRRIRPDLVLGADLIAGFPTEDDAMFNDTVSLVSLCGLTFLHVFPFSPRQDTPAFRMPQVNATLARQRAAILRRAGDAALRAFLSAEVGAVREILVESPGLGRTKRFASVLLEAVAPGEIVSARIVASDGKSLSGIRIRDAA